VLVNKFLNEVEPISESNFDDPDYMINIINVNLDKKYFFKFKDNIAFITTKGWEETGWSKIFRKMSFSFSPPSIFEYLQHAIIASLLKMNLKELNIEKESHNDTRGCFLDFTRLKNDDRVDIVLGYICDECKNQIIKEMGEKYFSDVSFILSRKWIGKLEEFGSVAYDLNHYFKFNIDKDSGFKKTFWENSWAHFPEIPKETIMIIIGAAIGILLTKLLSQPCKP
jgi:hypothetical protein